MDDSIDRRENSCGNKFAKITLNDIDFHSLSFVLLASIRQTEQKLDAKYDSEFDVTSEFLRISQNCDVRQLASGKRQHLFKY